MLIASNDGSVNAGIFTAYNGAQLTSGDHYLIEERAASMITVRQPMGANTQVRILPLADWDSSQTIEVLAFAQDNHLLDRTRMANDPQGINFDYYQEIAGQGVAYYRIRVAQTTTTPTPTATNSPTLTPTPTPTVTPTATRRHTPTPTATIAPAALLNLPVVEK